MDPEEPLDILDSLDDMSQDEAHIVLSIKWITPDEPQHLKKLATRLEKVLQSWFSKHKVDCSVEKVLGDGRVVIKTKPAPVLTELQKLNNQTLTGRDGNSVTVTSVSLTLPPPEVDTQVPEDASMNLSASVPDPQTDQVQVGKRGRTVSAGEDMCTCSLPVGHFWYVNQMYEEELKRIEKENGVKIMAEVKVRFEVNQKHGSPDNALNEFTNLVQKDLIQSSVSVIPLKFTDPGQWGDALQTIQKKENKLLVTLTSETMTLRGPTQSQEAIKKFLNADTQQKRKIDASHEEYERETQDSSLKIDMTAKDHLMHTGVTMEESYWKVMITSYSEKVAKIKAKFNVDLKESDIDQGKVNVKAVYKKDEGNASMESHALKSLLGLYQKVVASPITLSHSRGATGFSTTQGQEVIEKFLNADTHQKKNTDASHEECERETQSLKINTQVPEDASVNFTLSLTKPQTKQVQPGKRINAGSAAEEDMCTCSVPVGHFWYVNSMYKEDIKHIEKDNAVKIKLKVKFEIVGKHGNPDNALKEFKNLMQNRITESNDSVIPLKFVDPDQWRDALKTIQKNKNKLLITLTCEGMTVRGPTHSQDVISKLLFADTLQHKNTHAFLEVYEKFSDVIQDTSLKIDMTTKDHLVHMGLTMEERYWKVMITSYSEKVAKIKAKFNVDLKESDIDQGKVNVKAVYKKDEGNASMESHAVRELFHLYQKTATSPMNFSQSSSGMWDWSWLW